MESAEKSLAEAAERATAILQSLQLRLGGEAAQPPPLEAPDELDRELQEYFGSAAPAETVLSQIREQVVEAVADRIFRAWQEGRAGELGALENQVIDRLAERVLAKLAGDQPRVISRNLG